MAAVGQGWRPHKLGDSFTLTTPTHQKNKIASSKKCNPKCNFSMDQCCSVKVCKNRSETSNFKSNGITYHRFPRDPTIKEKWIDSTNRGPNWWPLERSTICSAHFEEKCFRRNKTSRRLFEWSVPTLRLLLVFAPQNETKEQVINNTPRKHKMLNQPSKFNVNQCESQQHLNQNQLATDSTDETPRKRKKCESLITTTVNIHTDPGEPQNETKEQVINNTPRKRKMLNQRSNVNQCESQQDLNQNQLATDSTDNTPRKRKMRLQLQKCQSLLTAKNKKIRNLQKKTSRYKKKIVQLNEIIEELQTKDLLNSDQATHLENVGVEDLIQNLDRSL